MSDKEQRRDRALIGSSPEPEHPVMRTHEVTRGKLRPADDD